MVYFKILYTLLIILGFLLVRVILRYKVKLKFKRYSMDINRKRLFNKMINYLLFIIAILSIIAVWGIRFEDAWVFLASAIGLVAIGFFATWSVLSNLLAGMIVLINKNFKIGQEIEILPEAIKGKIKDIGPIYTVIEAQNDEFVLPNNMFLQKIVKTKKK